MIKISICLSDLPKEKITTAGNGKKYVDLVVSERREPSTLTRYIYHNRKKSVRAIRPAYLWAKELNIGVFRGIAKHKGLYSQGS